jgi:hypothetical protein
MLKTPCYITSKTLQRQEFYHNIFILKVTFLEESLPGTGAGIVGAGEIVQDIFVDEPGIMELDGGQVPLTAKPLDCFRVDPEPAAGLDDVQIIVQDRHNRAKLILLY